MQKIVLIFGLIAGAIFALMMLATVPFLNELGFDKGLVVGYTTIVLGFLMIFAGVKSYRDNVAAGSVSFGHALVVGLLITAVASVCYVVAGEFVYRRFMPDFAEKYAAYAVNKERQSGASDAKILAKEKEMEEFKVSYRNPVQRIAYTVIEPLPVGIVLALVAAGMFSRRRRSGSTLSQHHSTSEIQ